MSWLMDWMGLEPDAAVEVEAPDIDAPPLPPGLVVGQVLPVATLLKKHLDIRGRPNRYLFELLANFTASEMEVRPRRATTPAPGGSRASQPCLSPGLFLAPCEHVTSLLCASAGGTAARFCHARVAGRALRLLLQDEADIAGGFAGEDVPE